MSLETLRRCLLGAIVVSAVCSPRAVAAARDAADDPSVVAAREEKVLRLGIAGGMMFAQVYTTTALVATGALLICWHDSEGKYCGLESAQSAWYELYIPAAGPFVALRHEEVRSNWIYTAGFSASGVLQSVGVTLAVVSLLWPKSEAARMELPIRVVATREAQLLAFTGAF